MSSPCLNRVSAALNTPAASNICLEQYRMANKLDKRTTAIEHAPSAFRKLQELLKEEHGIRVQKVTNNEIKSFFEEARVKEADKLSAREFQDAMTSIVKYAALRARHSPRRRFALGVVFSSAAAVGITAATAAASTGLLVAAAPAGAALGAFAVGCSWLGSGKRDKRRASKHVAILDVPAAVDAAVAEPAGDKFDDAADADADDLKAPAVAEIPSVVLGTDDTANSDAVNPIAEEAADLVPVPAEPNSSIVETAVAAKGVTDATSGLVSHPTPKSDELVSAVIEVLPTEETPAAAPAVTPKETPFASVSSPAAVVSSEDADVALASAYDTSLPAAVEADPLPLPDLVMSRSPEPAELPAAAVAQPPLNPAASLDVAHSADLPPLALRKKSSASRKLKKGLSKSYKSLKKAMSLSDTDDKSDKASKDPLVTPSAGKPPSVFSLRRSFSRDSARDINGDLSVQGSEGSATLKKMKEVLRRSFTINTPRASIDGSSSGRRSSAAGDF